MQFKVQCLRYLKRVGVVLQLLQAAFGAPLAKDLLGERIRAPGAPSYRPVAAKRGTLKRLAGLLQASRSSDNIAPDCSCQQTLIALTNVEAATLNQGN